MSTTETQKIVSNDTESGADKPTHLYLIRHGQSNVNVEPIVGGMRGDRGLTELGRLQAERLRDRLEKSGEIKADVLIASTLPRARQTAEIIQPALGIPMLLDDDVQEIRLGIGDGMPLADFKAQYGWVDFDYEPHRRLVPESESLSDFVNRTCRALERITREHAGKTIVVVCHGGIVDSSFYYFFDIPMLAAAQTGFNTHNTSITHWARWMIRGKWRWRIERYNDDSHLVEVGHGVPLDWASVQPAPARVEDARLPVNPLS